MILFRYETLNKRIIIYGNIVTSTPLHIGRGRGEKALGEPDLPIQVLPSGEPYIPGSSIKGALRSEIERIVTSLGIRVCIYEKHARNIAPDYECSLEAPCISCDIFGSKEIASKIIIRDALPIKETKPQSTIRPGISLERDTKKVSQGPFLIEYVPPGTEFRLEIVFENPEDWMLGLLFTGLESIHSIGGQLSRGMGKVKINIEKIEEWTAQSIIQQKPAKTLTNDELKTFIEDCKRNFRESLEKLKKKYGELKRGGK